MKVLFIGQYFPPEMGALAGRISELAEIWAAEGCQVTVLTGFPNYPSGQVPADYQDKLRRIVYRERTAGYRVVRTWLTTMSNEKALARVLGYISFFFSSLITGLFLSRSNVIIASSPPLTVGLSGWLVSRIKGVPFVFEIRDLWPESITASGVSKQGSLLIRTLGWMSSFLYQHSDHFVVVSPAFQDQLQRNHNVPPDRIHYIPNGVKLASFKSRSAGIELKQELGLGDRIVAAYIGNYGWAQGLETVIEAAAVIQGLNQKVAFLFVGGGADEQKLKEMAASLNLKNVQFVPQQPKERIPDYIQAADICLVPLRDEPVFGTAIPSKMFEFMAGSRPVVLAVKGQARQIMERAKAGIAVDPQDPEGMAQAILQLAGDAPLREELGQSGRDFVGKFHDRHDLALTYKDLLERIAS